MGALGTVSCIDSFVPHGTIISIWFVHILVTVLRDASFAVYVALVLSDSFTSFVIFRLFDSLTPFVTFL